MVTYKNKYNIYVNNYRLLNLNDFNNVYNQERNCFNVFNELIKKYNTFDVGIATDCVDDVYTLINCYDFNDQFIDQIVLE